MVHRYLSVEKYKIMQEQTDRIPKYQRWQIYYIDK